MSGMNTRRYVFFFFCCCFVIKIFVQAHPKAKGWRTKPFPLYDDILPLVEGRAATGEGVFRAGKDLLASQDLTSSDESEHESGGKVAPVIDGDDDQKGGDESGENVSVFLVTQNVN
jgi:hypothetical protein